MCCPILSIKIRKFFLYPFLSCELQGILRKRIEFKTSAQLRNEIVRLNCIYCKCTYILKHDTLYPEYYRNIIGRREEVEKNACLMWMCARPQITVIKAILISSTLV